MVLERLGRVLPRIFTADSAAVTRQVGRAVAADSAVAARATVAARASAAESVVTKSGMQYTRQIGEGGHRIYTRADGTKLEFGWQYPGRLYPRRFIRTDVTTGIKTDYQYSNFGRNSHVSIDRSVGTGDCRSFIDSYNFGINPNGQIISATTSNYAVHYDMPWLLNKQWTSLGNALK